MTGVASDPIFDTNIVIDWLRRRPQAYDELDRYGRHRISRITWAEVLAGEPIDTRAHVQTLIAGFDVIEVDERIALAATTIRYGSRIKLLDALILATAQVHNTILITRNTKDLPVDMPGIRVPYTL